MANKRIYCDGLWEKSLEWAVRVQEVLSAADRLMPRGLTPTGRHVLSLLEKERRSR